MAGARRVWRRGLPYSHTLTHTPSTRTAVSLSHALGLSSSHSPIERRRPSRSALHQYKASTRSGLFRFFLGPRCKQPPPPRYLGQRSQRSTDRSISPVLRLGLLGTALRPRTETRFSFRPRLFALDKSDRDSRAPRPPRRITHRYALPERKLPSPRVEAITKDAGCLRKSPDERASRRVESIWLRRVHVCRSCVRGKHCVSGDASVFTYGRSVSRVLSSQNLHKGRLKWQKVRLAARNATVPDRLDLTLLVCSTSGFVSKRRSVAFVVHPLCSIRDRLLSTVSTL